MPNWNQNHLTLLGTPEEIAAARQLIGRPDHPVDFEVLLPRTPDDPNWYDWSLANWGTKWNVGPQDADVTTEPEGELVRVTYRFDTAWSPPLAWLSAVVKLLIAQGNPLRLELKSAEMGMGFGSHTLLIDGDLSFQEYQGETFDTFLEDNEDLFPVAYF